MLHRPAALVFACACALAAGLSGAASAQDAAEPPRGRLPADVRPTHYSLDFRIDPAAERFSGRAVIAVDLESPRDAIWMHGAEIAPETVTVTPEGGAPVAGAWEQVAPLGLARIDLPETLPAGAAEIEIAYTAPYDISLAGLYRVEQDGRFYVASQMQPIDGRRAFPGFDQPEFKTPFDIAITAPADTIAATNAPRTGAAPQGDGWVRHTFAQTEPLPTYLIAIVVGPYETVEAAPLPPTAVRDRPVPLRAVAAAGKSAEMGYALETTQPILEALEAYFGAPYPYAKLDIVAAPDFAAGAMENAGAILYREPLALIGDDPALNQRRSWDYVHAHELAHQWFGNLVTPVWWNDIWLNESFATWMGYKAVDTAFPQGEYGRRVQAGALGAMAVDALSSTRQVREPVPSDDTILNAFDGITYQKGAGVLAMFEAYLGEDRFRDGVRTHVARFADDVATADDFFASMAEGAGEPEIAAAFSSFVEQPGVPVVALDWSCGGDGPGEMRVTQARYHPLGVEEATDQIWLIPMALGVGADGERADRTVMLDAAETSLGLDACPDWIMPNAGGAGYYRFSLPEAGWRALLAAPLTPADALSAYDNLEAEFRAGRAGPGLWLDGAAMAAGSGAFDVASAPLGGLANAYDRMLDAPGRAALQTFALDLFGPAYDAADGDSLNDRLTRVALTDFMALYARDPDLRAELEADAASMAGLEGDADPQALSPDVRAAGVAVLVQERGAAAFDAVLETVLASPDQSYREQALSGLAQSDDPALGARLLALAADEEISGREAGDVVSALMANPAQRPAAWAWLTENFPALAPRVPGFRRDGLIFAAGNFCDAGRAAQMRAYFETAAEGAVPGYQRAVDLTEEDILTCAALRERNGEALSAALTARTGG